MFSDSLPGEFNPVDDGTLIPLGTDLNDNEPVEIVFHDMAVSAETSVPDTGSTVGLFFCSLIALIGLNRLRFVRAG